MCISTFCVESYRTCANERYLQLKTVAVAFLIILRITLRHQMGKLFVICLQVIVIKQLLFIRSYFFAVRHFGCIVGPSTFEFIPFCHEICLWVFINKTKFFCKTLNYFIIDVLLD